MSYKNHVIVAGGGGGKGGGARAAVEAPNSLRSKQIAHLIDLLGEGEWEGLVDGPAGIYLNGVQLFTPTSPTNGVVALDTATDETGGWAIPGAWNYKGVSVEFRNGTQSQSAIRTISTASSAVGVNAQVNFGAPIPASISVTEYDLAVVTVQVDSLFQQNAQNGDIGGWYVDVTIEARLAGGTWLTFHQDRITGKTMNPYTRGYPVDLHAVNPNGPWEVRVTRSSPDDADSSKHSVLRFIGVTLNNRDKFRYPNSVLCALGFDASQISSVPTRAYDVKMTRCRVPSNYNPTTRAYTGTWDGTFVVAWTDNPAWCVYEMATNDRFGLGQYFDETLLDKWSLYTIAQYCDQLVSNGRGGSEPRFTMNAYFQTQDDAIALLQNMASCFRSIIYYMGGSLVSVQDAPADPVYAFNTTNVVDGKFSYAGASQAARHTVAMVVWNNPELNYRQDIEYVEDPVGLAKFGYRPLPISAIGCTSRGQAHRMGAWALYVEQHESDVVTFETALEGTGVQPGKIIEVFDPTRAGVRMGGRCMSIAGSVMTMDATVNLPNGTHTLVYIGSDGALKSRTTTIAATGNYSTLTLNAGTDALPEKGTVFGIQTSTLVPQYFRITSITENGPTKYQIIGIAHDPNKYAAVEAGLILAPRPTSVTSLTLPAISSLVFSEYLYLLGDESVGIRLNVSWAQQQYAMGYMISYRIGGGNWSSEKMVLAHEFVINPVAEGVSYGVRVTPISAIGTRGAQIETTYDVQGEKTPPPKFDYFTCIVQPDGTRQFDFGYTTTPKPIDFKGARIRYYQGVTTNWDIMIPLENEGFYPFSPLETNQLLSGTYTVAARAEDRTKNQSDPIFVTVTLPDRRLGNILVEYDETKDGWTGTKTSCHLDPINNVIEANDTTTWATLPSTWTAWTRWNVTPASPITYTGPVRDLVSTLAVLLDIGLVADGSAVAEVRYSNDNVTYSAWVAASTAFTARYFQLRLTLTATGPFPVPVIRQLNYRVGGRVKKETLNDVNIAAYTGGNRIGVGDVRVVLTNTYTVISRVTVMAIQDANPGWTWLLVDRSTSGPHVKFYKNGVLADPALVDFYIEGY
jgi:predicted phage tail protein